MGDCLVVLVGDLWRCLVVCLIYLCVDLLINDDWLHYVVMALAMAINNTKGLVLISLSIMIIFEGEECIILP
jgi:hypothetical protein